MMSTLNFVKNVKKRSVKRKSTKEVEADLEIGKKNANIILDQEIKKKKSYSSSRSKGGDDRPREMNSMERRAMIAQWNKEEENK